MAANNWLGRTVCGAMLCLSLAATAWCQIPTQYIKMSQDGSPIPDVNKFPFPPAPGDNSCWLASASNILAAAGYGSGGPAQLCAQNIYNQLTAAYGTASGGAPDQAISFWLATHGKNPSSPDYRPSLAYTDVTAVYRTLTQTDYNFLKGELYRCQYVGVQFDYPSHAVTLVGWNDNLNQSIWHDSDINNMPPGNDAYNNSFTMQWDLVIPGSMPPTNYLNRANGYVTFCPGPNKDPDLVANYDVAWTPGPNGPFAREAGAMVGVFDPVPGWQQAWLNPGNNTYYNPFHIDNELDLLKEKRIELLVDFYGRDANYATEDIRLRYVDENGFEVVALPTSAQPSTDNGQILFTWQLDIQPGWEEILFPSYMDYGLLEGKVASWDVALICIPEPVSIGLLAFAGLALLRRRLA